MISLKDISEICGLSVSTVSRALNDYSDISVQTREYVKSVADRIGYTCNKKKQAAKTPVSRSSCIGLIYRGKMSDEAIFGMDLQIMRTIRERVFRAGYDSMMIRSGEGCKRDLSWLACARFHALEGVIVLGSTMEMYGAETMDLVKSEIPVVIIGQAYDQTSSVHIDFASGMDGLMREIYQCGYRKIAFLCPESGRGAALRRTVFLRNVLRTEFISSPEQLIVCDRCSHEEITFYTKKLVRGRECPECILYPDDISALWGMEVLLQEGIRVPGDIGIAGFGGMSQFLGSGPSLTTWDVGCQEIGELAADDLFEQIIHPELFLPQTRYARGNVLPGTTIRPMQKYGMASR